MESNKYPDIIRKQGLPSEAQLQATSHWIVLGDDPRSQEFGALPYAQALQARWRQACPAGSKPHCKVFSLDLPNAAHSHVAFMFIPPDASTFEILGLCRKLVARQQAYSPASLGLALCDYDTEQGERIAEALVSAALASHTSLPSFKKNPPAASRLTRLLLYGAALPPQVWQQSLATASGNSLARSLSVLPGNELTPTHYLERVRELAKQRNWNLKFHSSEELANLGAGAFLAVAQASPRRDAGIVQLQYRPNPGNGLAPIALVGKGICYDTGGVNVKPARAMYGMHEDMQGSAVALGTFLALTELEYDRPLDCWLAIADNYIGSQNYKPNDVVTAMDGTSIEVVHTDAEGRMVLADTLVLASREQPALIMDYATLTGSCIHAIGTAYSGVFSNRVDWHGQLIELGERCGERVWPFPMDKDFDEALRSEIADVKQCSMSGGVDHILAACFLKRFVGQGIPWLHFDLSASNRKRGLAHIPTATTGFGVRYSVRLLTEARLLADLDA
ncbi:MAG: M17 family metallopeptidase [Candidatus Eutrophobiaceae bacterium]